MRGITDRKRIGWGLPEDSPHPQAYQPDFIPLFCWSSHFLSGAK